jgi:ligand-binding sensor domain-containing protein
MLLTYMVKKQKTLTLFLILLFAHLCHAQEAYNWKTLSSLGGVNDAVQVGSKIWAATSGGAFSYDQATGTYFTLTRTDGLQGIILRAVVADNSGRIWFGSQEGAIDVYNPATGEVQPIYDIYNYKEHNAINSFLLKGDTLFVCTDFGIAVYRTSTMKSIDQYLKFGTLDSKIPVSCCYSDGSKLYVGTTQGIAIQKSGATNPASQDAWTIYTTDNGLYSNTINCITSYKGALIVGTGFGPSVWDGTASWSIMNDTLAYIPIIAMAVKNDSLLLLSTDKKSTNKLWLFANNSLTNPYNFDISVSDIYASSSSVYLNSTKGLMNIVGGTAVYHAPNGPYANQFNNLSVDIYGNIWSSSGKNGAGKGTYFYNRSQWHNFNPWQQPVLPINDVYNVSSLSDGLTYLCSWGAGFSTIDTNGNNIQYTTKNSPMVGIPGSAAFLVITDVKMDSKGNRWILNYWSANRKTLFCLTKDSTWYAFPNYADSSLGEQYMHLAVDQYDTKWFTYNGDGNKGLYFLNENGTLGNTSDDQFGYLSANTALSGKLVNCIALDKRGELWIGTSSGLNILYDPSQVLTQPVSAITLSDVYPLRPINISCMAVDALNRKWIGTNQGLLLISDDGSTVLATYTKENSVLLSNQILSLAVDEANGLIYVGMDIGLMCFSTKAVAPNSDFSLLRVYPNPFLISASSNGITIDGLIKDSEVKILDISGKVVKTLVTPGGRTVRWDGRLDNGSRLNSGIYLVAAYDKDGNSVGLQKFAVVRK